MHSIAPVLLATVRQLVVVGAALVATSCVTALPPATLITSEYLQAAQQDLPKDAEAIVLLQEERFLLMNPPTGKAYMEVEIHRVFKVLTEAAFPEGSTHIFIPENADLVSLQARTISPRGEIIPLDAATVLGSNYEAGDNGGRTKSFQFPRVEVGSVLEYIYTIHHNDGVYWSFSQDVQEQYPIREYRVELVLDKFAKPDLLVNNARPKLNLEVKAGGLQHVTFALRDVPARPRDAFLPAQRETAPWWIYRTIEWNYPNRVQKGVTSWSRAVGGLYPRIVEHKDLGGFSVRGDDGCRKDDRRCIVDAALKTLHEDVELASFMSGFGRPLPEVKASKRASNMELALALYSMLRDRGLEPEVAPTHRVATMAINESFPAAAWLNHLVVYVPGDEDEQPLWVDPSCESCTAGVLPDWSMGSRAFRVTSRAGEYGPELLAADFQTLSGEPARTSATERDTTITVAGSGDATFDVVRRAFGAEAVALLIADGDDDDDDVRADVLRQAQKTSKSASLRAFAPWDCNRAEARCEQRFSFEVIGYATRLKDSGRLLVSTAQLETEYDDLPPKKGEPARTLPVVFFDRSEHRDSITIVAPAGYTLDPTRKHRDSKTTTDGFVAEINVEHPGPNTVTFRRSFTRQRGRHQPAYIDELHKAMEPSRALSRQVVAFDNTATTPASTPTAGSIADRTPQAATASTASTTTTSSTTTTTTPTSPVPPPAPPGP